MPRVDVGLERRGERHAVLGDDERFAHANVADVALDGSVFFLYAPFNGAMLTRVLERLEEAARKRAIVVCTVHLELRDAGRWLAPRKTSSHALAIYDSAI